MIDRQRTTYGRVCLRHVTGVVKEANNEPRDPKIRVIGYLNHKNRGYIRERMP